MVPPGATVVVLGVNAIDGVALTVAAWGEGVGLAGGVTYELDEPHAARPATTEAETIAESIRRIMGASCQKDEMSPIYNCMLRMQATSFVRATASTTR
ncbi:MAG: hypothetical protein ABI322_07690 [Gemmatimonadaceae bacterium]